jgi:hypothetical protein
MTLHSYRGWIISAVSGAVSPHVVIGVWAAVVGAVWVPSVRYLWEAHHLRVGELPVNVTWVFDALFGAVAGALISLLTAYFARTRPLQSWLVFILCFLGSALIPFSDLDFEQVAFFIRQPIVACFAVASLAGFWLRSRLRRQGHAS